MYKKYNKFLIEIIRNYSFFPILNEFYSRKDKDRRIEFHIHTILDKPLILVSEGSQIMSRGNPKSLHHSTLYFEAPTLHNGEPIAPRQFDALHEISSYKHTIIRNKSGKQVARFFQHDVKEHGLDGIMKKLGDEDLLLSNPWKYFSIDNVDFLKSSDNFRNSEKITNAKIKRFPEEFQEMIGYKPFVESSQIPMDFNYRE